MGYHIYCEEHGVQHRKVKCQCLDIGRSDDPINNCSHCQGDGTRMVVEREGPTVEWSYGTGDPIFQVVGWSPIQERRFHRIVHPDDLYDLKRRIEFACRNSSMRQWVDPVSRPVWTVDKVKGSRTEQPPLSDQEIVDRLQDLREVVCYALEHDVNLVIG